MAGPTVVSRSIEVDTRLGRKYELWDELPDGYRDVAGRVVASQALAEIVGVLPFADWIEHVPDYSRKQMLIAKVQDEIGHGQVTARVAEDLGVSRTRILSDFIEGRAKLLNVFHYGFETWEEIGPAALLMNSAAIVQFQSLDQGTYLPYTRALRKIEKEESFHYHHALDLTHQTLTLGSPAQRALVQDAFETWLPRMLAYFGPPDHDSYRGNAAYRFGIKVDSNDALRQRYLTKIIPVFQNMGISVDPAVTRWDEETGRWLFDEPDWGAIKSMLAHGGPRLAEWRERIAASVDRNSRYRNITSGRSVA